MPSIQSHFWDDKTKEIFLSLMNNPNISDKFKKQAEDIMISMEQSTKNDIRLKKIKKLLSNVKEETED